MKLNLVADLSQCDRTTAKRLVEIDNDCIKSGAGGIYGQLVVLGYKVGRKDSLLLFVTVTVLYYLPSSVW